MNLDIFLKLREGHITEIFCHYSVHPRYLRIYQFPNISLFFGLADTQDLITVFTQVPLKIFWEHEEEVIKFCEKAKKCDEFYKEMNADN